MWPLVYVGGRHFECPGPSPTFGSLMFSHQWCHKPRGSLRGLSCVHDFASTHHGEVCDIINLTCWQHGGQLNIARSNLMFWSCSCNQMGILVYILLQFSNEWLFWNFISQWSQLYLVNWVSWPLQSWLTCPDYQPCGWK